MELKADQLAADLDWLGEEFSDLSHACANEYGNEEREAENRERAAAIIQRVREALGLPLPDASAQQAPPA